MNPLEDPMHSQASSDCRRPLCSTRCFANPILQVELIEMPFTVITCADVLLVNLERVGFNLRNFDMTVVFKVHAYLSFP